MSMPGFFGKGPWGILATVFLTLATPFSARAQDVPEWVVKGPGIFKDGNLYAVGVAGGKGGVPILSRTADNRARANLAALIRLTVSTMTNDFESSAISTEELVTRVIVYEGSVEVTDLSGSPETFTLLGPGTKLLVVDGEGFGRAEPFKMKGSLDDWERWADSPVPETYEK